MKILSSKIFLLFCLIILIFIVSVLAKKTYQWSQVQKEVSQLKNQFADLEKESNDLAALKEQFGEPWFIEQQARQKLNLKKPGETVVVPIRGEGVEEMIVEDIGAGPVSVIEKESLSNPSKWWNYFFKRD